MGNLRLILDSQKVLCLSFKYAATFEKISIVEWGFIEIIKAVAAMQRLFCMCLNIVDAQLAGVLGDSPKGV